MKSGIEDKIRKIGIKKILEYSFYIVLDLAAIYGIADTLFCNKVTWEEREIKVGKMTGIIL